MPEDFDILSEDVKSLMHGYELQHKAIKKLKADLSQNPSNIPLRLALLGYYEKQYSRRDNFYELLNWLIDNEPRREIHEMFAEPSTKNEAFRKSKRHWLKQLRENPNDVKILFHVARFCSICDPKATVKYLKRATAIEPESEELARCLAHAYSSLITGVSTVTPKYAVREMIRAVTLYEKRTDVNTYLVYFFDSEMEKFARIAIEYRLFEEAEFLGKALLDKSNINSKRFGIEESKLQRKQLRATAIGLSLLGQVAIAQNKIDIAKQYLRSVTASNVCYYANFKLAELLLAKSEVDTCVSFLSELNKRWKHLFSSDDDATSAFRNSATFNREWLQQKISHAENLLSKFESGRIPKSIQFRPQFSATLKPQDVPWP